MSENVAQNIRHNLSLLQRRMGGDRWFAVDEWIVHAGEDAITEIRHGGGREPGVGLNRIGYAKKRLIGFGLISLVLIVSTKINVSTETGGIANSP